MQLRDPQLLRQQAYIDGAWCDADDGASLAVHDPASGELLGTVPDMGGAEAERAILAAQAALPDWQALSAGERARILRRWYDLLLANADDLALLLTLEQGKPLAEARGEIAYAASYVEWFAEEGKRLYGDLIPGTADKRLLVLKQGIGVCAAITPWNFPAAMITRKVAPALAAGCCMVLKPANETPFSALALAELAHRAGVPAGVFSVITGAAQAIGAQFTSHPLVRKLSFTGSTAVGRMLMAQCAPTIKKLSLELGGNAPFIVFADADLEAAVEGAIAAKFRNAGQTCVCVNRFYIHESLYAAFVERFVARVRQLRVGHGVEIGSEIGPLISPRALAKVRGLITDALERGASLLAGGEVSELGGCFLQPAVLGDVRPGTQLLEEEIFGPVAALQCFSDEREVLELANATPYGLAAYFYSRDIGRVWRVAEGLEFGMVGINTGLMASEAAPFGGVKQSGLGREGSRYGVEDYLELKYLCLAI